MTTSIAIAVTGLGLVCPLGNSVPDALARAMRGERGIRVYRSPYSDAPRVGGTVENFTPDPQLSRHEPATAFALTAAGEALAQARLGNCGDRGRMGCVVGAGLAGAELWHRALSHPHAIPRMAAIQITGTAVTGLIALKHQLRGPSIGIANACASGTSAIIAAADQIRLGRADVMLAGATESSMRSLVAYASFVEAGMNPTPDPVAACTPFATDRRGFVLAEGAGMLVLERLEFARARGARVLAILAGSSIVNDAHHAIHPEPTGAAWSRAIKLALDDAKLSPTTVDAVSAHATATAQGDLAEARALNSVFGSHRVAVSATKSMHGHAFGAAGAIESALAVAAMTESTVLPTIDLGSPDPACALDHVTEARRTRVDVLLKTGFGAGGVATALVFRRPALHAPLLDSLSLDGDEFAF